MVERITGFSGFDVETTVKKLMQAHRVPLDLVKQKQQVLQWQRDDYRTMNSKILDLRNNAFTMKLQGSYLAQKASVDNENIITAKGTTNAIPGNYTMEVKKMATSATIDSGVIGAKAKGGLSAKMSDLGLTDDQTLTITGEKGSATVIVNKGDTLGTLLANVNSQSTRTGVRINYDDNMDRVFLASSNTGTKAVIDLKSTSNNTSGGPAVQLLDDVLKMPAANAKSPLSNVSAGTTTSLIPFTDGAGTVINSALTGEQKFKIVYNGKTSEFKVLKDTTLFQVIAAINASDVGKLGVSAYVDENKRLVLVNPDTSKGALGISEADLDPPDILPSLGLVNSDGSTLTETPQTFRRILADASTGAANDAVVSFNGNPDMSFQNNTFSINGIQFTAKKLSLGLVNVAITSDTETIYNNIKSFIDKYNDTLDSVYGKLGEERLRSFQPLTDDQRASMKEEEIKKWEEKAKSGLLRKNDLLSSAANLFRSGFSNVVGGLAPGDLKQLSELGIKTSQDYTKKGKLEITEATLRQAISNNPEQIMNLFTAKDDTTSDVNHGIAVRIYDIANNAINTFKTRAGNAGMALNDYDLGKQLKQMDKQVQSMTDRLTKLETRYYKQFSAMEAAINKYNAQGSSLASYLGSGK